MPMIIESGVEEMKSSMRNDNGFTLIEVLIALFLLSVGFMATTNMQTTAIHANKFAKDSTIAIQLVDEMIDRIRLNGGNNPFLYNGIDTSADCSGAEPRLGDCTQWKERMTDKNLGLINAVGTVSVSKNTPIDKWTSTVAVTIRWGSNWGVSSRTITLTTIIENWV